MPEGLEPEAKGSRAQAAPGRRAARLKSQAFSGQLNCVFQHVSAFQSRAMTTSPQTQARVFRLISSGAEESPRHTRRGP